MGAVSGTTPKKNCCIHFGGNSPGPVTARHVLSIQGSEHLCYTCQIPASFSAISTEIDTLPKNPVVQGRTIQSDPIRKTSALVRNGALEISKNVAVADIIAQMPAWADAQDLTVEPFGGLTNTNYLVTVNGEGFVVRLSGRNSDRLGINRERELEALETASAVGIGPEVVRFFLPEGHLVTRLIEGRRWTVEEYRTPQNLQRMVEVVKRLHGLPAVKGTFSPFRRVESYATQARAFHVPFPEDFGLLVKKMLAIEADQHQDAYPWLRFCHNDLFSVNFLDDGTIRVVDWEFAGMGDIYFDLATLVYAYDSDGPLPVELETYLLACYSGAASTAHRARLEGMKFMLLFFTAMWGLLQHGLQLEGIVPTYEGFDCLAYAREPLRS